MKKILTLVLSLLFLMISCVWLTGCNSNIKYVTNVSLDNDCNLIAIYSDGSTENLGCVKGEQGIQGLQGQQGVQGETGKTGSTGDTGNIGLSAYEIYKKYHPEYTGTEQEWVDKIYTTKIDSSNQVAEETGSFEFVKNADLVSYTLTHYYGSDRGVNIPSTYKGFPVTEIGEEAFSHSSSDLETLIIPDSITKISKGALYSKDALYAHECNVTQIIIGKNVSIIEAGAFAGLSSTLIYYKGTLTDWSNIDIDYSVTTTSINYSTIYVSNFYIEGEEHLPYFYSETQPTTEGNYWHYVNNEPVIWESVN